MARAALCGGLMWLVGTVLDIRDESQTARTLTLRVPGWPGHLAGQHVDVRLTAPDGYSAARSYSIGSAPELERIELTVERIADGEVSPYLADGVAPGDPIEIRGPLGGWFVWRPDKNEPVQLVAGGSGMVPLMSMIRARSDAGNAAPFRLLYSVRRPESILYREELERRAREDAGLTVTYAFTRSTPEGWSQPARRVDAGVIADVTFPPSDAPACFVCGPTPFVEAVADLLTHAGHDSARIKTERFGPSGGPQ